MRFERIDLDRYGCFTDHSLNFGEAPTHGDFHIVYGANEAGKSTVREACIDFLYGIHPKTLYAFLHSKEMLQISAALRTTSSFCEARRIRHTTNSFLRLDNSPTSDAALKAVLGDVSRDKFEQMFFLNEESLEKGSQGILNSEGDLGALLFSAVSGLSSFNTTLDAIQKRAEEFYKPRAQKLQLNELKQQLEEIKSRIREKDMLAGAYAKLKKELNAARQNHEDARASRDEQAKRLHKLRTTLDAIRPWKNLKDLEARHAALADIAEAPEGWLEEAEALRTALATAKTALEGNRMNEAKAKQKCDGIDRDAVALEVAPSVKRLRETELESRFRTASDIEKREQELKDVEQEIGYCLIKLGQAGIKDPKDLILPVSIVAEAREFIEKHGVLMTKVESTRESWEQAYEEEASTERELADVGELYDLAGIEEQLRSADEKAKAYQDDTRGCRVLQSELDKCVNSLFPWQGDLTLLQASPVVTAEHIQHLKETKTAIETRKATLKTEKDRLEDEQVEHQAVVSTLTTVSGVIDDQTAQEARMKRDNAWLSHRSALDADTAIDYAQLQKTADAFAAALEEDDRIYSARFSKTSELSQLQHAQLELAKCSASLDRNQQKYTALSLEEVSHTAKATEFFSGQGLPETFLLDGMDRWLERKGDALQKMEMLSQARQDEAESKVAYDAAVTAINASLSKAGLDFETTDWDTLKNQCYEVLKHWQELKHRKQVLESAYKAAAARNKQLKQKYEDAQKALEEGISSWRRLLESCWIGSAEPIAVKAILNELDVMSAKFAAVNDLRSRIEAMTSDKLAYSNEVERIAALIGISYDAENPLHTGDFLHERVAVAEESERNHVIRTREWEEAVAKLEEAELRDNQITARIDEMRQVMPADDLSALIQQMRTAQERNALKNDIATQEASLQVQMNVLDMEKVRTDMEPLEDNPDLIQEMQVEYDGLLQEKEAEDQRINELYHDWQTIKLKLAAIGSDDEVARLEDQYQTILDQIKYEANQFMQQSAGVMLVKRALVHYREAHRSSMMERASDAFVTMTCGAFKKLDVSLAEGKNSEVLVAIRSDGTSIAANMMSKGTLFQLYLALRIAGHAEFAKHREMLPFFADDILEPFDDERSAQTFKLLHEMSKRGQVVYLTHHRHLCDLAKSACGEGVTIHALPDRVVNKLVSDPIKNAA